MTEQVDKKRSLFNLKGQVLDIWKKLLKLKASPHSIALGLALGIFIGFLPIMGIQMGVVLVFALPFRSANKIAAVSGVWISNPLTVVPIYAFIYWIGTFFYPKENVLSYDSFTMKFNEVLSMDGFIDQTKGFIGLGADIFIPMCVGGSFVGLIAAVITYFITKRAVRAYRLRKGVCDISDKNEEMI